jgi:hypothetical protein
MRVHEVEARDRADDLDVAVHVERPERMMRVGIALRAKPADDDDQ